MKSAIVASTFITSALAAAGAYQQCGGSGFSGETTCISGWTCTVLNQWYSQCLPGAATTSTTAVRTTLTTSTVAAGPTAPATPPGKFKWFGVNEAGAEFGQDTYPGLWGKHFTFPSNSAMQTLINQGYNTFRVGFAMERLAPTTLTGTFDAAYLRNLTESINYITNAGAYAVLDPHNFGRYFGKIITNVNDFKSFWTKLATQFVSNPRVIFDTNNEYHTMDQQLVFDLNQGAIDAIRATGATSQYIWVEGNAWSGAWTWISSGNGASLVNLRDPENKMIYEMHQYLDTDGSGTNEACVSTTIGTQRLQEATAWLRANKKLGVLGEFAGGANPTCQAAVKGLLDHLKANSDVWTGALWWAAGPWWGDYMYGFEPPSSTGYTYYNSLLRGYM
ncbi:cellulase [Rhypophila decipiens]|uniref:cellulase n=1 Tax=Rhypophila decipiens TaxID=261697 RepID=A0AAN7B6W4_9PEZI|nr:cellulase [Rhypophila decipiens]